MDFIRLAIENDRLAIHFLNRQTLSRCGYIHTHIQFIQKCPVEVKYSFSHSHKQVDLIYLQVPIACMVYISFIA